jgi:hypothetical protein
MHGAVPLASVEEVRAFWELYVERHRQAGRPLELHRSRKKLHAYVSDGRWVAECPECGGGVALWQENPEACCLDCATVYSKIGWPHEREIMEAERVLAARPTNQLHWRSHEGETVEDLKIENIVRGLPLAAS